MHYAGNHCHGDMFIGTMPFVIGDHGRLSTSVIGAPIRMDLRVPVDQIRVDVIPHRGSDRPFPIAALRLWLVISALILFTLPSKSVLRQAPRANVRASSNATISAALMSAFLTVTGLAPSTLENHSNQLAERSGPGTCNAALGPAPANRLAVAVPAIPHQSTHLSVHNRVALTVFEMEIEHHFLLRTSKKTNTAAYRAMPAATNAPTLRLLMPLKRNPLIGIWKGRPDRHRLSPCASAYGDADLPVKGGARIALYRSRASVRASE